MTAEILIVDDEPDICELVAGILQDEGYDVDHAVDGIVARLFVFGSRVAEADDQAYGHGDVCSKKNDYR